VADRQLVGALVGAQSTSRAATSGSTTRTATIPAQRAVPSIERGRATGRAYARREDRLRKVVGGRAPRPAPTAGRAKFVLLIMGLLAVGLIVTLWLSTAAAADSYRLQDARVAARALSEQSEQLRREVTAMDAAPALAQRAASLGMVPVQDSARLVVAPDGAVTVAGTPKAAIATAPPPAPAPVVAPNGTTPSATATPSIAPGADPNTPTADAAAAAGAAAAPTSVATPTPAPNGQANRTSTTATPRAGAPTSAPATSAAAASRTPAAAASRTPAAAASRTPAAAANAARTAGATPTPTAAARTTAPAAGTAR